MRKARLLKVQLQAVLVVEDEDGLDEIVSDPVVVPARQWESFRAEGGGFDQALDALKAQIEGPPTADA